MHVLSDEYILQKKKYMKPLLIIHFPWHFNKKIYFQVLQWELTQLFEDPSTLDFFEYYIVVLFHWELAPLSEDPFSLTCFIY